MKWIEEIDDDIDKLLDEYKDDKWLKKIKDIDKWVEELDDIDEMLEEMNDDTNKLLEEMQLKLDDDIDKLFTSLNSLDLNELLKGFLSSV